LTVDTHISHMRLQEGDPAKVATMHRKSARISQQSHGSVYVVKASFSESRKNHLRPNYPHSYLSCIYCIKCGKRLVKLETKLQPKCRHKSVFNAVAMQCILLDSDGRESGKARELMTRTQCTIAHASNNACNKRSKSSYGLNK